jgi:hypothetical protein
MSDFVHLVQIFRQTRFVHPGQNVSCRSRALLQYSRARWTMGRYSKAKRNRINNLGPYVKTVIKTSKADKSCDWDKENIAVRVYQTFYATSD